MRWVHCSPRGAQDPGVPYDTAALCKSAINVPEMDCRSPSQPLPPPRPSSTSLKRSTFFSPRSFSSRSSARVTPSLHRLDTSASASKRLSTPRRRTTISSFASPTRVLHVALSFPSPAAYSSPRLTSVWLSDWALRVFLRAHFADISITHYCRLGASRFFSAFYTRSDIQRFPVPRSFNVFPTRLSKQGTLAHTVDNYPCTASGKHLATSFYRPQLKSTATPLLIPSLVFSVPQQTIRRKARSSP